MNFSKKPDLHDINLKDPKPPSQALKIVIPLVFVLAIMGVAVWAGIMIPEAMLDTLRTELETEKKSVETLEKQVDAMEMMSAENNLLRIQINERPMDIFIESYLPVVVIARSIEAARPRGMSVNKLEIEATDGYSEVKLEAVSPNSHMISQFIARLRMDKTLKDLYLVKVVTKDDVIPYGDDEYQTYSESTFELLLFYAPIPMDKSESESENESEVAAE